MIINGKKIKTAFVHQLPHPAHRAWARGIGAKFMYFRGNKKLRERGNRHILLNLLRLKFTLCKPDVIISEGGAPLFPSVVLHNFSTCAKIILIMADETGIYVKKNDDIYARDIRAFLTMIDGAISVSSLTTKTFEGLIPDTVPVKTVRPSIGEFFLGQTFPFSGDRRKNTIGIVSKGGKRGIMNKIPGWLDECFYMMKKKLPDLQVIIAGANESPLKFENTRYSGIIDYKKMPAFYKNLGVLFHFPDFDPFPVSLMEALACGCPVLVGKGAGNFEYFQSKKWTELMCDDQSPYFIARKAVDILSGSVTFERLRLFSETVSKELSPERSALEFRKALEEILAR